MARFSSRQGAKTLLRSCSCWNFSESFLSGNALPNVLPVLGGIGGSFGSQGFRVGSIRGVTFDASPADHHGDSYTTRILPGVKFDISASGGMLSQTAYGSLGFSRTCTSQSTSPAQRVGHPIVRSAADGSQKVIARISNVPKFVFKIDLIWLLKGCNLTPEDFLYIYDTKYRVKFIEMQLPSRASFQLAQRSLASKGRFGGRYLKLTSEEFQMDDVNKGLGPYRGRSLLMSKVPVGGMTEDVERFFSGYALDAHFPIKFLRSPVQVPVGGNRRPMTQTKAEFEETLGSGRSSHLHGFALLVLGRGCGCAFIICLSVKIN
ncbi:unnamed protein product [Calypogeia fissa]